MKTIKLNAVITSIRSKVDGSLGLSVSTPELTTAEKIAVMEYQGVNADLTLESLDSPSNDSIEVTATIDGKTPSKKLRAVIWRIWEKRGSEESFDVFYIKTVEKIRTDLINKYLED